jgi:hypothetical protein
VAKSTDLGFLREVLLFKDLAEDEEAAVWTSLEERRLRRGDVLFREGDGGKELFFIRSGTVVVSKHVKGRVEQVITRLGPGMDRASLDRLIERNPRAATAFFSQLILVLIKRLRDSTDLVAEVTRWGLEATGLDVERPATGGH